MIPPTSPGLEAIARAGIFVFGIVMAIIGAVTPALLDRLSLTLGDVGTLFLVMNFSMLVASLALGLAVDRVGLKLPLAAGAALVALALVLIGGADSHLQVILAAACLGFGGGAVNGASNTLVADLHEDPRRKASALNTLGVFFGVGALLLPFSLGALSSTFGLAGLLYAAAVLCGITGIGAAALRFPPPKQLQGWPVAQMPRFIRMPAVLLLAGVLFLQSGSEFLLGGYIAAFLALDLSAPAALASYALASYWAAIMVARIVLGRLLLRVTARTVVLASALLSAACCLLMAAAGTAAVGVTAAVLTGLSIAGIFPTVLSLAGARFPDHSGTVFGILFTVALSGGMTIPWLAGHLAESIGLRVVFVLGAVNFGVMAALMRGWR